MGAAMVPLAGHPQEGASGLSGWYRQWVCFKETASEFATTSALEMTPTRPVVNIKVALPLAGSSLGLWNLKP